MSSSADSANGKIYFFFSEFGNEFSFQEKLRIPRVAQVCKVGLHERAAALKVRRGTLTMWCLHRTTWEERGSCRRSGPPLPKPPCSAGPPTGPPTTSCRICSRSRHQRAAAPLRRCSTASSPRSGKICFRRRLVVSRRTHGTSDANS